MIGLNTLSRNLRSKQVSFLSRKSAKAHSKASHFQSAELDTNHELWQFQIERASKREPASFDLLRCSLSHITNYLAIRHAHHVAPKPKAAELGSRPCMHACMHRSMVFRVQSLGFRIIVVPTTQKIVHPIILNQSLMSSNVMQNERAVIFLVHQFS